MALLPAPILHVYPVPGSGFLLVQDQNVAVAESKLPCGCAGNDEI